MAPNKQVSPVIRISQGERDASARATHLEAATRKFLVTTNERKQMSTKTNFKRIALVAVAALGMGVLSSVPSQAVVSIGSLTLTTSNGTATIIKADTTGAGSVTVRWTSITASDSIAISSVVKSVPTGATAPNVVFSGKDTLTAAVATVLKPASANSSLDGGRTPGDVAAAAGSPTAGYLYQYKDSAIATSVTGYNSATFRVQLDSFTSTRVAGTYTYTITAVPYTYTAGIGVAPTFDGNNTIDYSRAVTAEVSIVIAALASASTVSSAANSSAWIATTSALADAATGDAAINVPAAVSATNAARAYIDVDILNASGNATDESVTVTTNIGQVGTATIRGKDVTLATSSGSIEVLVYSDGTAGTATITVKTATITFPSKTVTFYAAAPSTIVASVLNSAPGVGTTDLAIAAVAKDSNGNAYSGTLYVSSDALTVIEDTAAACSYNATNSRHECSVTGVIAGSAKITVRDKASGATIVSSNAVDLTVTSSAPVKVSLAFDKATYAPGEKATLLISVLDAAGKSVKAQTFNNLFATGGITLSTAAGNGSETVTAVSATTVSLASYALGTLTTPVKAYTLYMPNTGGTLKATATGGTSLALAGQVEVSASATVTDNAAAALAAVTALATTVASLKTLITTLTNLVLKIQKKVKA